MMMLHRSPLPAMPSLPMPSPPMPGVGEAVCL